MELYIEIKDALTEIQFIINRLKQTIAQAKHKNVVDMRIFDSVITEYFALGHEADQIKKTIDGILLCRSDSERLDFFLNNIYNKDQFDEDII
jgi:hypothetical protein